MKTKEQLNIEKAAKNRAYAFILAMGLLKEFHTFVNTTHDLNPHELCQYLINNK